MSTVSDNNPFAPPNAHVEDVAQGESKLAGRGARLGAALIDTVIQLAVYYGLAFVVFSKLMPSVRGGAAITVVFALQMLASFALFIVVHGYLLATRGQTVGKKLVGLRIVRSNGERASVGRLIGLRYCIGWVIAMIPFVGVLYAIVDSLMIFRDSHKCLHDNIADTMVVKA